MWTFKAKRSSILEVIYRVNTDEGRSSMLISHLPLMQWKMAGLSQPHPLSPTNELREAADGQKFPPPSVQVELREKLQANIALGSNSWRSEGKGKGTVALFQLPRLVLGGGANNYSLIQSCSCHCLPTIYQVMNSVHAPCLGSTVLLTVYWLCCKAGYTVALWRIHVLIFSILL